MLSFLGFRTLLPVVSQLDLQSSSITGQCQNRDRNYLNLETLLLLLQQQLDHELDFKICRTSYTIVAPAAMYVE